MKINIIGDSRQKECDTECGVDWSSEEALALARQRIVERFGQGMELQYLDLTRTAPDPDVSTWRELIREKNLSLPLLLLNDHIRISGEFDTRQLLDAIDAEMEIGG